MLTFNRLQSEGRESPTLVVVTTALQLALVVVVWLLALAPAAVAALTVLTIKTLRATFRKVTNAKPPLQGGKV
jgi:hypothetical protein